MRISRMAPELRFQIQRHFDIDTRINQLLEPCSINGTMRDPLIYRLLSIPDLDQLIFVYENGIIKKLTKDGNIHPNLDILSPTVYTTSRGTVVREHPIYHYELGCRKYSDLTFRGYLPIIRPCYTDKKKKTVCSSTARLIADTINMLKGLTSGVDEFDHRIRKIVYDFIIGIHIYTRKTFGPMILAEKQQIEATELNNYQLRIRRNVNNVVLPELIQAVHIRTARMHVIQRFIAQAAKEEEKLAKIAKKEEEKLAKIAKKEEEKLAKIAKKEEEKLVKIAKKEEEKLAKIAKKEEEKLAKIAKKEEEKLAIIAAKEEEKLAKIAKKEEEKRAKIAKKEEEKRANLAITSFSQFIKVAGW